MHLGWVMSSDSDAETSCRQMKIFTTPFLPPTYIPTPCPLSHHAASPTVRTSSLFCFIYLFVFLFIYLLLIRALVVISKMSIVVYISRWDVHAVECFPGNLSCIPEIWVLHFSCVPVSWGGVPCRGVEWAGMVVFLGWEMDALRFVCVPARWVRVAWHKVNWGRLVMFLGCWNECVAFLVCSG